MKYWTIFKKKQKKKMFLSLIRLKEINVFKDTHLIWPQYKGELRKFILYNNKKKNVNGT